MTKKTSAVQLITRLTGEQFTIACMHQTMSSISRLRYRILDPLDITYWTSNMLKLVSQDWTNIDARFWLNSCKPE